jgi:hypothetical protein
VHFGWDATNMKWLSRISLILAAVAAIFFFTNYGVKKDIFYGDALGYYSYLPSAFCLNNLDSIDKFPQEKKVAPGIQRYFQMYRTHGEITPKGFYINQYTYGVALFELPFFLVAKAYVQINNQNDNGYTLPYHTAVLCSSLFYLLLGLFFCYKNLRFFYPKSVSILGISILLLASNLFWFSFLQLGMVHIPLFFLVSLLIYCTIQFYKSKKAKWLYFLGLTLGLITLLRPTDIIFGLIPLLYKIDSVKALRERLTFLIGFKLKWLLALALFLLPILPQLIFWKIYAGSFIYYSYNGQSFNFSNPALWKGLFGAENGWLLYSPIWLLLALLFFTKEKLHGFKLVTLIVLPLYCYIIYSWFCYQYINGFGSRPMIHIYPLLAIALAAIFQWAQSKKWMAGSIVVFVLFFSYINLHYSQLNAEDKYCSEFSNYEFYRNMMFKNKLSYNDMVIKDSKIYQPLESKIQPIKKIGFFNFKNDTSLVHEFDTALQDSIITFPAGKEFAPLELQSVLEDTKSKDEYFIKASCAAKFSRPVFDRYRSVLLVHKFNTPSKDISWHSLNMATKTNLPNDRAFAHDSIRLFRSVPQVWDTLLYYIPVPKHTEPLTSTIEFWNMAQIEFQLQFLQLELYKKK